MNILFVSSEVTPLVKTGGLGDVVGALPMALRQNGHDARILIPRYEFFDAGVVGQPVCSTVVRWLGRDEHITITRSTLADSDVPLYFLAADGLEFHGRGVYADPGDPLAFQHELQRFAFFSAAVVAALPELGWRPDVLHCHDWPTGLIPTLAKAKLGVSCPATIVTIHNLKYQGTWEAEQVFDWLGLSGKESPVLSRRDAQGRLNLLQQGILAADAVNTVSPTYAKEITTTEYGEGLENDLRQRAGGVSGITNGIDVRRFDPQTDPDIAVPYGPATVETTKAANRRALQQLLHLPEVDRPVFGVVSRLTQQKGFDLLQKVADDFSSLSLQLVILGSGEPDIVAAVTAMVNKHANWARLEMTFNPALAQKIYAGSDFFLMPSRYEPCGLGQLIAMRYGTLPVVRQTGGLADTVIDVADHPTSGTGLVFAPYSGPALVEATTRAVALWGRPADRWAAVQRAMNQDFSWNRSAHAYEKIYTQARRASRPS